MNHFKEFPGVPKASGPYSILVVHENLAFTSGILPVDADTGQIVNGGIESQTRQCMNILKTILESAGSSLSNLLKITLYLSDMKDFPEVNRIYGDYFKGEAPARSCVGGEIPREALVEIDAIASISSSCKD